GRVEDQPRCPAAGTGGGRAGPAARRTRACCCCRAGTSACADAARRPPTPAPSARPPRTPPSMSSSPDRTDSCKQLNDVGALPRSTGRAFQGRVKIKKISLFFSSFP
uniref:Uncharacterized protein n=1 Tax=Oryza brachyantha TaxID=4533 RepID=J3LDC5_ORYBR